MTPTTPIVPGMKLPITEVARHQSEYLTLPAFIDSNGIVLSRWQLNWRERARLLWQGFFYLKTLTFNHPLQPLRPSIDPPGFDKEDNV